MRKTKRTFTLMEIMIVIVLIGLIASVIGMNMKGSLDAGKAFKTEQAQEKIADILSLAIAKGEVSSEEAITKADKVLKNSGLVKDPEKFLKDGWNEPFAIKANSHGEIEVTSEKLKTYKAKKDKNLKE